MFRNDVVTNSNGAKQSRLDYRFDLMDPHAMFSLAEVLHEGAVRYGDTNWKNIPIQDHLNHALAHVFAYMAGDGSEKHLQHALCRLLFAHALQLEVSRETNTKTNQT